MTVLATRPAPVSVVEEVVPDTLPPMRHVSVAEYLELERNSLTRHEYFYGEVLEMPGAKPNHNTIAAQFIVALDAAITDQTQLIQTERQRIRVEEGGPYLYADVVVTAPNPQYDEDNCLLNLYLIVEIISPSSANYDQNAKFEAYRRIRSLVHFVLVEQDAIGVTHGQKQADNSWRRIGHYTDRTDTLILSDVNVSVSIGDIYRRITFPEPTDTQPT